jgi:hypothetical protein
MALIAGGSAPLDCTVVANRIAGWTRSASPPTICRVMPLDLTDAELATAATACRALAYQEGERAKKMENPGTRAPIENAAKRYGALAGKLEAARRRIRSPS